ncbi:hypothetical protein [Vagococcus lutrae]|nr:hypothetical protein [Vagococcus lutrae]MDT2808521.1 hypothetical protein [Vagococcus lutrae]
MRVMTVFLTQSETIKMCPLVKELKKTKGIEALVTVTGNIERG